MTEIEQHVADLIAENAGIDRSLLQPTSTMDDFSVPSIAQLETLFAVEEAFDIYLPDDRDKHFTLAELAATVQRLVEEKRR